MDRNRKEVPIKEVSRRVRERFRHSLKDVGHSMDFHIYDYEEKPFIVCQGEKKMAFLRKVKAFYDSLDAYERHLFVKEVLEEGRHYHFWYLPRFGKRAFEASKASLIRKMEKALS